MGGTGWQDEPRCVPIFNEKNRNKIQARNNARVVIAGSYAMFSDKFQANNAAQADFAKSVLLWATKNAGVLRHNGMKHARVGELDTPSYYTIEEQIR